MFESIQPAKHRRPPLIIILSIAAHAGALALLAATALWQIDKLGVDDAPLMVAAGPGAPLPSAEEEEAAEPDRPQEKEKPREARDLTQIDKATADVKTGGDATGKEPGTGTGKEPGDGMGPGLFPCGEGGSCSVLDRAPEPSCGNGTVEKGEECDDGNRAGGDGCGTTCKRDREKIVLAHLIEGSRIEGDPQIAAPDSVRQQMTRSGTRKVKGVVSMCLDKQGRVRALRVLESTGYREYDQRLLSGMRGWRYEPYRLDSGAAVPVCTVVTFIYRVQ